MKLERTFAGLNISAMGLNAQRKRMNAIASNLANAETTRTEDGGPYRRKIVQLTAKGAQLFSSMLGQPAASITTTQPGHISAARVAGGLGAESLQSLTASETLDTEPPRQVYDPGNPDANGEGYVSMPNVNVVTEMVNMISASRAFEANVVAINAAKTMAKDSLEI